MQSFLSNLLANALGGLLTVFIISLIRWLFGRHNRNDRH